MQIGRYNDISTPRKFEISKKSICVNFDNTQRTTQTICVNLR